MARLYTEKKSQTNCTLTSNSSVFNLTVTGPFLLDATVPEITNFNLTLNQTIFQNQSLTSLVVSSTLNVSQSGYVYIGASLDTYEGPIPYIQATGDQLLINSSC